MRRLLLIIGLAITSVTACAPSAPAAAVTSTRATALFATETQLPTSLPSLVPTLSATPDPYFAWSIAYLRARPYGGGQIEFLGVMGQGPGFTRYQIRYPSDGLNIYGFANIPDDVKKHPVII